MKKIKPNSKRLSLMMKPSLLQLFLLLGILQTLSLQAQKSVDFNGKSYRVYPYKVYTYGRVEVNRYTLALTGNAVPPILDSFPDGDYLIYSAYPKYKKCKKIDHQKVCDTVWKVYATFKLSNGKKNGDVVFYHYKSQKPILTLPYKNDVMNGQAKLEMSHNWFFIVDQNACIGKHSCVLNPFNDNFNLYDKIDHYELEMNYVDGIPSGKQKIFAVLNQKKYLVWDLNFIEGKPDGDFTHWGYQRRRGKLDAVYIQKGTLSFGLLNGKSEFKDLKGNVRWNLNFKYNQLIHEESYNEKWKLKVCYITGDTVSKMMINSKMELMNLYNLTSNGWLFSYDNSDQFALFIDDMIGHVDTVVRIGNKVSKKYYELIHDVDVIRDTMILGHPAIVVSSDNGYFKTYGEITFLLKNVSESTSQLVYGFKKRQLGDCQLVKLYTINQLANGRKEIEYEQAYYILLMEENTKISNRNLIYPISNKINRNIECEKVYDVMTNSELSQFVCYNKERKILEIKYKRFEHNTVSFLTRNTTFNDQSRQLLIVDTLYREDKLLSPFDPILHLKLYSKLSVTSETQDMTIEQIILSEIYKQLLPSKVKHQMVFWNGKPMDHELLVKINYTNKKFDAKLLESIAVVLKSNDTLRFSYLVFNVQKVHQKYAYAGGVLPVNVMRFSVNKGVLDGQFYVWGKWENEIASGLYAKNKLDSVFALSSIRMKGKLKALKVYFYDLSDQPSKALYRLKKSNCEIINESLNFKEGQLNDQVSLNSDEINGNKILLNLKKDQPVGHQLIYDDHNRLKLVFNAKDGFENSEYAMYDGNGHLLSQGQFVNGYASGSFVDNLSQSQYSYLDGHKIDTSYTFDLNGALMSKCYDFKYWEYTQPYKITTLDVLSDYLKFDPGNFYRYRQFLSSCIDFRCVIDQNVDTAMFENYFENGKIYSKGIKMGAYRLGNWDYYRENGSKYKSIQFYDDLKLINNAGDSAYAYAYTTAFYPNGKIMFKGYSVEYSTVYSCENKVEIPTDQMLYKEFYDSTGQSLLDSGSGFVVEYLPDGKKLREGHLLNFKKTGTWVEYDRFGSPIVIGQYSNGKKQGRWLSGDLSGLNLPQNICFMDDEEFNSFIKNQGKKLHVSVFYYINGFLVDQAYYHTIKE